MGSKLIGAAVLWLASGIVDSAQSDRAADLPYAGTWKLNVAKSDFGETTVMYAKTPSGQMQFTALGQSYAFQMDGKEYPSPFGGTAAWKQIDATTWETAIKQTQLRSTATLSGCPCDSSPLTGRSSLQMEPCLRFTMPAGPVRSPLFPTRPGLGSVVRVSNCKTSMSFTYG